MSQHALLMETNSLSVDHGNPPHASLLKRKVIHFDMDCFYAAVEMRDDPSLRHRPVIVGGDPNSRGVVCTANYKAREFGVHSAMAAAKAKKLCPQAVFLRPDFQRYQAASVKIREIFKRFTSVIEPLSLDEAYLDVTHNPDGLYAVKITRLIQEAIQDELQLSGSAGVAPNKLVAKIASDYRKPNGLTVVLPHRVTAFMSTLSLRKISGIGPATETRLNQLGYQLCQDIWAVPEHQLIAQLGERMGRWLSERARGIDTRPVQARSQRKSIGKEDTFRTDILDITELKTKIQTLANRLVRLLQDKQLQTKNITLKVKYSDFKQITRSTTLNDPTCCENTIAECAQSLLAKTQAGVKPVRLLGVSLSKLDNRHINDSRPNQELRLC